MSAGRALVAVPLPSPDTWRLLRDLSELPDGYGVVGSITIGRADPLLQASAKAPSHLDDADGVTLEQWRELFALFARMTAEQRDELIAHARNLHVQADIAHDIALRRLRGVKP